MYTLDLVGSDRERNCRVILFRALGVEKQSVRYVDVRDGILSYKTRQTDLARSEQLERSRQCKLENVAPPRQHERVTSFLSFDIRVSKILYIPGLYEPF